MRSVEFLFFQAEDGIRDIGVTGVQTCALPISQSGVAHWDYSCPASKCATPGVAGRLVPIPRRTRSGVTGKLGEVSMLEVGFIKRYWPSPRGYGFIKREGCPDVFFRVSELEAGAEEAIREGMRVEFTYTTDPRGRLQATSVRCYKARKALADAHAGIIAGGGAAVAGVPFLSLW